MLDQALQALPAGYRPDPKDPDAAQVLIRSDSAGATYCWASIRLHTEWSLKAIVSIPRSLRVFVVSEEGVKVESPQRSEENRP